MSAGYSRICGEIRSADALAKRIKHLSNDAVGQCFTCGTMLCSQCMLLCSHQPRVLPGDVAPVVNPQTGRLSQLAVRTWLQHWLLRAHLSRGVKNAFSEYKQAVEQMV